METTKKILKDFTIIENEHFGEITLDLQGTYEWDLSFLENKIKEFEKTKGKGCWVSTSNGPEQIYLDEDFFKNLEENFYGETISDYMAERIQEVIEEAVLEGKKFTDDIKERFLKKMIFKSHRTEIL